MIDLHKCIEFIRLQDSINKDIDMKGETSPWKAAQLDVLADKLNEEEIDWVLDMWPTL